MRDLHPSTLASYIREAVEFYLENTEDEFPREWYAGEQQEAGNCTFSLDYLDEYLADLDKVYGPKDTPERDEQRCLHSSRILEQILPVDASEEADEEARRLSEELLNARLESTEKARRLSEEPLNARLESTEEVMPAVIDWNPHLQPVETRSSACTSTEPAGEAGQKPAERPPPTPPAKREGRADLFVRQQLSRTWSVVFRSWFPAWRRVRR